LTLFGLLSYLHLIPGVVNGLARVSGQTADLTQAGGEGDRHLAKGQNAVHIAKLGLHSSVVAGERRTPRKRERRGDHAMSHIILHIPNFTTTVERWV
jgi:hypothetical protein